MERRRRGHGTEWSTEDMDQWLRTPEDDPDSCSSESSLTDSASNWSADESDYGDGIYEPNEPRREFRRDTLAPTITEKVAMMVTEQAQQPQTTEHDTSAPFGSIGRLRSSADDGSCEGTTRRTRMRHPSHAETRFGTHPETQVEVSWSPEADAALNRHLSLLQMKCRGISAIRSPEEWEEIEVTVDSGACVTVMPKGMCMGISVLENSLSREGAEYEVANGQSIPNLGERRCEVMTAGSTTAKHITFQVADVHKPLLSITACADMGFDCFLGSEGGMLRDRHTHEIIPLDRKGTLYTMKMWVRQDPSINISQPFVGQG